MNKAHGLLFKAEMIRAFLHPVNPKTQTRRVPTAANSLVNGYGVSAKRWAAMQFDWSTACVDGGPSPAGNTGPYLHVKRGDVDEGDELWARIYPRVQPGDLIWAKETYCLERQEEWGQLPPHGDGRAIKRDEEGKWLQPHYRATDPAPELAHEDGDGEPCVRWKSSLFIPRWASRIERTVVSVRAERVQTISEADAKAEGVTADCPVGYIPAAQAAPYGYCFAQLWSEINGVESWDANPFAWVYDLQPVSVAA